MSNRSKKPAPLFVKSNAHPILSELTAVYELLEVAVVEAEKAYPLRLQAMSELFQPQDGSKTRKDGKTQRELANERKLAYLSACCREEAVIHPLCDAMDRMYDLLQSHQQEKKSYRSRIGDAMDEEDFLSWMRDAAHLNLIECTRLYQRAVKVLSRLNLDNVGWEYGECAKQAAESELEWIKSIPRLPSRELEDAKWVGRGCAPKYWRHVAAHVMGKVLAFILDHRRGGFSGCLRLNDEGHEVSAGYHVMRALKALGWKVGIDSEQEAFCVSLPTVKEDER